MSEKRIFIGNISHDMTKEEMTELLTQYGTVESLRMRKNDGFALAQMSSLEENQKVLDALEGMTIKGRELHTGLELSKREARKKARNDFAERIESRKKEKPEGEEKAERKPFFKARQKPEGSKPSRMSRKISKAKELSKSEIQEIESKYPENKKRRKDKTPGFSTPKEKPFGTRSGSKAGPRRESDTKWGKGKDKDKKWDDKPRSTPRRFEDDDHRSSRKTGADKGPRKESASSPTPRPKSKRSTPEGSRTPGASHKRTEGNNEERYAKPRPERTEKKWEDKPRSSGSSRKSYSSDSGRSYERNTGYEREKESDSDKRGGNYLDKLKKRASGRGAASLAKAKRKKK